MAAFSTSVSSPTTPTRSMVLLTLLAISALVPRVTALNFVAGGPCASVCSDEVAGIVSEDVRCLDNEFDVTPASYLKSCVSCQLNSTAVDPTTKATDVQWGLFNLRYILSNCMFGVPQQPVSISSPCQVTCAPLQAAVAFGIVDSTNSTVFSDGLDYCTGGRFDDYTINQCAFCYSFVPQQLILGNFLQSLHIACHSPPPAGRTFYPDGVTIFNSTTIAGPSGAVAAPISHKLSGFKLILAIVLPLLIGVLVLAGTCFCCWHFTKNRRARMAASGRMSRFHDGGVQDFSPMTPKVSPPQPYTWTEPDREMQSITVTPKMDLTPILESPASRRSPGVAQGRWSRQIHDESSTPLTPHRASYVRPDEAGTVEGELKDPNLHEQYLSANDRASPQVGVFRAQDGFVDEHTHGTWM